MGPNSQNNLSNIFSKLVQIWDEITQDQREEILDINFILF